MSKSMFFLFALCFPFLIAAEEDDCAFVEHPLNRLDIEKRVVSLPPVRSPLKLTYLVDPFNAQVIDSLELTASENLPKDQEETL